MKRENEKEKRDGVEKERCVRLFLHEAYNFSSWILSRSGKEKVLNFLISNKSPFFEIISWTINFFITLKTHMECECKNRIAFEFFYFNYVISWTLRKWGQSIFITFAVEKKMCQVLLYLHSNYFLPLSSFLGKKLIDH